MHCLHPIPISPLSGQPLCTMHCRPAADTSARRVHDIVRIGELEYEIFRQSVLHLDGSPHCRVHCERCMGDTPPHRMPCRRSSVAEQRFRKPQVVGSSPTVGSQESLNSSGFEVTPQSRFSLADTKYINYYINAREL